MEARDGISMIPASLQAAVLRPTLALWVVTGPIFLDVQEIHQPNQMTLGTVTGLTVPWSLTESFHGYSHSPLSARHM
jgi:hypothetical protein